MSILSIERRSLEQDREWSSPISLHFRKLLCVDMLGETSYFDMDLGPEHGIYSVCMPSRQDGFLISFVLPEDCWSPSFQAAER